MDNTATNLLVFGVAIETAGNFVSGLRLSAKKMRGSKRFPKGVAVWNAFAEDKIVPGALNIAVFDSVWQFEAHKIILPARVVPLVFDSPLYLTGIEHVVPMDYDPADPWALVQTDIKYSKVLNHVFTIPPASKATYAETKIVPIKRLPIIVEKVGGTSLISFLSGFLYQLTADDRLSVRAHLASCLTGKMTASQFRSAVTLVAERSERKVNISKQAQEELCAFLEANLVKYVRVFGRVKMGDRQRAAAVKAAGMSSFEDKFLTRLIEDSGI